MPDPLPRRLLSVAFGASALLGGGWEESAAQGATDPDPAQVMATAITQLLEGLHRNEEPPLPRGTVRVDERILVKRYRMLPGIDREHDRKVAIYIFEGRRDSSTSSRLLELIPGAKSVDADGIVCTDEQPRNCLFCGPSSCSGGFQRTQCGRRVPV